MSPRAAAGLVLLAFTGFWLGSWGLPLFDLDEGAFSQATLEMLSSGNFLTTTLDGAPRYDKPMLAYWLQGASVGLLGVNEFAFRLPSMLAASGWLLLLFRFVSRHAEAPREAWLAASALALGLMPAIIGHAATADALLNLFIAGAGLSLWQALESGRRGPLWWAALFVGLGVLTKGPVAILVPAASSLVWALWQRRLRRWLSLVLDLRAWALFALVVLPWGIACWRSDGGEFLRHFLLDHNLQRYSTTLQGHGGQPWYYLVALPLIVLPFTALLPGALARGWRGDALDRYCLCWFGVVLLLFSFSSTQLPHYLLYGATPLFLLFGRQAGRLPAKPWLLAPAVLLLVVFASLPAWLPELARGSSRAWEAGVLGEAVQALDGRYLAITLGALLLSLLAARLPAQDALLAAAVALQLALWLAIAPALARGQQEPTRAAALHARAHGADVVAFATHLPTFSVYRGAITPRGVPAPGQWVFLRADKLNALHRELPAAELQPEFRQGGVLLLSRRPSLTAETLP